MLHNNNPIFIDHEVCGIHAGNQHTETKVSSPSFIKFPDSRGFQFLRADSIIYLKSDSNYTYVYFTDGKSQLYSKTLKILNSFLPEEHFVRIHKSYVVNKRYISNITNLGLTIENNVSLPISRRFKKSINF